MSCKELNTEKKQLLLLNSYNVTIFLFVAWCISPIPSWHGDCDIIDLSCVWNVWFVFSYMLRYIVGLGSVEMVILTNPKPAIYCNLYDSGSQCENQTLDVGSTMVQRRKTLCQRCSSVFCYLMDTACWNFSFISRRFTSCLSCRRQVPFVNPGFICRGDDIFDVPDRKSDSQIPYLPLTSVCFFHRKWYNLPGESCEILVFEMS